MKKMLCILITAVFCVGTLTGCECEHKWTDADCKTAKTCQLCGETQGNPRNHRWDKATCNTPKTCRLCGETNGEALGHSWENATCTSPIMCTVCSEISGAALGHSWKEATCVDSAICYTCGETSGDALGHKTDSWTIMSESTCSVEGIQTAKCLICGETVEEKMELIDHIPGDWIVTSEPTENEEGIRTRNCAVCGTEMETETFSLSAEELEAFYKNKCKSISYTDLSRYPDDYEGEYVTFYGKVVQICSEASSSLYYSTYRVAVSGDYDAVIYIFIDNYGSGKRILEDDWITIYGRYDGLYSYTTVMGAKKTIPSIKVEYVD